MTEKEKLAVFDDDLKSRRFLDDFTIADEADLGPIELELDRLDEFMFTARHGYLIHQNLDPDTPPCDVITISPGMSLADLVDIAKLHNCTQERKDLEQN